MEGTYVQANFKNFVIGKYFFFFVFQSNRAQKTRNASIFLNVNVCSNFIMFGLMRRLLG